MEETQQSKVESRRVKNLISAVILLGGLFLGSLFVDVVQMVKGSGYSARSLDKGDIFQSAGKTWVAYQDPVVEVSVVNDDSCENCDPSEALVWLRRVAPTISAKKVNFDSVEGKALIEKFNIKTIPAFIFSGEVVDTEFYSQAQTLFTSKDDSFLLRTQELGLAPGKYLATPEIKEGDAIKGNKDSNVKVVVFSDFQCPYCKVFHNSLNEVINKYQDRVAFSFKNLPLGFHAQAENAALAGACAQEQGKFWEYADRMFAKQNEWSSMQGVGKFKEYAGAAGLNYSTFSQCLDSKKYQDKINADKAEAESYGISGTPAVFVNDNFKNAALNANQLEEMIKAALGN